MIFFFFVDYIQGQRIDLPVFRLFKIVVEFFLSTISYRINQTGGGYLLRAHVFRTNPRTKKRQKKNDEFSKFELTEFVICITVRILIRVYGERQLWKQTIDVLTKILCCPR